MQRRAVCKAWQRLTGDAGAGAASWPMPSPKAASKPVCILFSPEQNILELIAESIGLLSPRKRFRQATFNTYFTSMPTSVVCAWRCCLAGTPAALTAARYATGGVVINLADPASLGTPPVNAWTTAARTGIAVAGKAPPRTAAESAKPAPMPVLAGPPLELAPEKPPVPWIWLPSTRILPIFRSAHPRIAALACWIPMPLRPRKSTCKLNAIAAR